MLIKQQRRLLFGTTHGPPVARAESRVAVSAVGHVIEIQLLNTHPQIVKNPTNGDEGRIDLQEGRNDMGHNSTSAASHGTETSSRCVTNSTTATHNFEVTRFSLLDGMGTGKCVTSSIFRVGGRGWNISLYPDGWKEDTTAYISVFLYLVDGATDVRAKCVLSLVDNHGQVSEQGEVSHTFQELDSYWGYSQFVEKSKLNKLLCQDDSFTIRCVLTVIMEPKSEDLSIMKVPESDMHRHFERMFQDGKGTDVTFSVDGQLFRAHRYVLAARSPVFDAEFFGPMRQDAIEHVQIDEMETFIFESLLHFIYTDRITLGNVQSADKNVAMQHLLVAADRYGLERLKTMCEAELCNDIDLWTVGTTLVLAEQHNCLHLKDACITFVASKDVLGSVLKTDGFNKHFMESCPLVMKDILHKIAKN